MTNIVSTATTALKVIAAEPEAAQTAQVAQTVEATSDWLASFTALVDKIDGYVWGVPLIAAILVTGLLLTCILRFTHLFNLREAFRIMFAGEEGKGAHGEVSQFGALCTALSATIGTGNIVGVATARAGRARCSGWRSPRSSAWRRSTPRVCSQSSTAR